MLPDGRLALRCNSADQVKADVSAPAVPVQRVRDRALLVEAVTDFPVCLKEIVLPSELRRPTLDETLQQSSRRFGAAKRLLGVTEGPIAVREVDQRLRLAISQLERVAALPARRFQLLFRILEHIDKTVDRYAELVRPYLRLRGQITGFLRRRFAQVLRLGEIGPGGDDATDRGAGEEEDKDRARGEETIAAAAGALRATNDVIKTQTEQPRDHLELSDFLAVAFGARVGRNRLFALIGQRAIRADLEAQRGGEAFAYGIAGLAIDNDRNDTIGTTHALEAADFLIHVFAVRRVRRA